MTYERSDGRGTCQIEDIARPCAKIGIPIFATHEPVAVNPVLDTPANSPTSQDAICFKRWMMPSSGGCTATRWLSKKKKIEFSSTALSKHFITASAFSHCDKGH